MAPAAAPITAEVQDIEFTFRSLRLRALNLTRPGALRKFQLVPHAHSMRVLKRNWCLSCRTWRLPVLAHGDYTDIDGPFLNVPVRVSRLHVESL